MPSFDINSDIKYLKGVGPRRALILNKMNIFTFYDFLMNFPRDYEDARLVTKISDLIADEVAIVVGHISNITFKDIRANLSIIEAILEDETDYIRVTWFNQKYLRTKLSTGMKLMIKGKVSVGYMNTFQLTVQNFDFLDEDENPNLGIFPIYPSSASLNQKFFRTSMKILLDKLPYQGEILPQSILDENEISMSYDTAIRTIHFPMSRQDIDEARYRLAFNELFLIQYGLMLIKKNTQEYELGIKHKKSGKLFNAVKKSLPFKLTKDQQRTLNEVIADMESITPMRRLIQGDVGSGKTVVAMLSLIKTVENGFQGVFMAPTEILAVQHFEKFTKILEPFDVKVGLLSAKVTSSKKKKLEMYEKINEGEIDIVIGTHALIEEGVKFKNLGLIITDEQHRFGVAQRAKLERKSEFSPDVLVMTATPIPRTMTLTVYGDLDVSQIKQLPPGRQPIKTMVRHSKGREKIYTFVEKELRAGRQAYVVCPLVEHSDSEMLQHISSAEEIFNELNAYFKDFNCGLLHGKMKPKEKDEIMEAFRLNKINLLVSTTVIEVGVDVPNASVMVIEHAERFGLATLHQLRGRVGRGSEKAYCILISDTHSEMSKARLKLMETISDGFKLAEEDLKLRGPGQFFGEAQNGLPDLKIANIFRDYSLLIKARDSAEKFVMNCKDESELELLNETLKMIYKDRFKQINYV